METVIGYALTVMLTFMSFGMGAALVFLFFKD